MKEAFLLNPDITYLNHGSFGACARPVFDDYQKWQLMLEKEPVQFMVNHGPQYLQKSKVALAEYIDCAPDDFFFTSNPTTAVNTIMRSLRLSKGDEILATDHEYGAMDRTWSFFRKQNGARYVRQKISLPIVSKEKILDEFWSGYSSRTRVIFINHMSSATALLFPVKEIVDRAKELGLITIVDGAHIPGHFPLSIRDLAPDFYTGALHKWMLTPKGCSFLYVRRELQKDLDPLVVSWGYESEAAKENQFLAYHEQQGTRDSAAYLTVPAAIDFLKQNQWKSKSVECRRIVRDNYWNFCSLLNTEPLCPVTDEFLGQMASIPVKTTAPERLKELLYSKYRIEIPVMTLGDQVFLRYSINAYNSQQDLDVLYAAVQEIAQTTDIFQF